MNTLSPAGITRAVRPEQAQDHPAFHGASTGPWSWLMVEGLIIARAVELPLNRFAEMLAQSEASGYRFLRRVVDEWESGANRFSRPGEALLIAELSGRWVGVCGLSIDPYLDDHRVGRVRNVYVMADCRRAGIGRRLVEEAVHRARGNFDRLRLRAHDPGPARLYESVGFRRSQGVPNCTHVLILESGG